MSANDILDGSEEWTCFLKDKHRLLAASQGMIINSSIKNSTVFIVKFPAGTRHAIGEFNSSEGKYCAHVFCLPGGAFWGLRTPVTERPVRSLEPWQRKSDWVTRIDVGIVERGFITTNDDLGEDLKG